MNWPVWWEWEIEITPHLVKRMVQRDFTEVDLRGMLGSATGFRPDRYPDRWIIRTRRRHGGWEVIVEPDSEAEILVIVTAYPT